MPKTNATAVTIKQTIATVLTFLIRIIFGDWIWHCLPLNIIKVNLVNLQYQWLHKYFAFT